MNKAKAGLVAIGAVAAMAMFAPAAQAAPCDGENLEQPLLDWNDKAFYGLAPGGDFESGLDGWEVTGDGAVVAGGNPLRESSSANALKLADGDSATTPPICVTKFNPSARIFGHTTEKGERRNSLKVEVLYLNDDGTVRKVKRAGSLKNEPEWDATRKFSLAQGQFKQTAKPEEQPAPSAGNENQPEHAGGPKPCDVLEVLPIAKPCDKPNSEPAPGDEPGDEPTGDESVDEAQDDAHIQLRFTPRAGSTWLLDDIFVDPRRYS